MDRFESMAEKLLREAIEAGEFDNLPGKGQRLDLSENPFEDPGPDRQFRSHGGNCCAANFAG